MKQKKNARARITVLGALFETLETRQLLTAAPSLSFNPLPFGTNQIIPAAQYDTGGEGVSYHDTTPTDLGNAPTYRTGSAVDVSTGGTSGHIVTFTQAGEYLVYSLVVPTTAMYSVQSSAANVSTGGLFHVDFNNVNLTGDFANPNTGSYTNFLTQTSAPFELAAGTYKMKVVIDANAANGAGGNLNWFDVIQTPAAASGTDVPFGTTIPGSGVNIPFVNYDKGGEGVAYHDTTPLNNGNSSFRNNSSVDISSGGVSGNIVGFTAPTEYLNYTINLPTGGNYALQVSAANTAAGGIFHLSENGVNLTGSVAIAATAAFTTYATDTSPVFKLPAGKQIVRLAFDKAATNGAVGNFDFFKLVPMAPPTEAPFTTAFAANVTIPAASYDKGGEGVAYHDTTPTDLGTAPTHRTGDAVDVSTGGTTGFYVGYVVPTEYLNYSLNIATAGMYELQANTANTAAGGTFHAEVAGVNLTGAIAVANSASYTTFLKDTSTPFTLAKGSQILHVVFDKAASNGAVGNFDYFKLVPFTPAPDSPFTTAFVPNQTIPAANYDKGGEGVSYHDTTPTNLGNDNHRPGDGVDIKTGGTTGNIVGYTAAGEWLQYTVTITTAGNYKLEASVANPSAGATFHVALGTTNLSGKITVTPTTDFNTYATDTSASFALSAGTHILRVFFDTTAANGAVGNFDWFKLVPA
jgi:hypothetical protein